MSEQTPKPIQPELEPGHAWDSSALANTLNTEPSIVEDEAFGQGQLYALGNEQTTRLEIYPETQTVRVTTRAARIELFQQEQPSLTDTGVVFSYKQEHQKGHLALTAKGDIDFSLTAATEPIQQPTAAMMDIEGINKLHKAETPLLTNPTPSEHYPETPSQPTQNEEETQPRLTLTGRVGRPPRFRTTPKGTLIASFPIAVHHDDDTTTWHTIVAFGKRAEKLHGDLSQGQEIEVIGYEHERQTKTRQGKPKTVKEIYAAVVKRR